MSATKTVTRSTKVVQRLEIDVNLGPLPDAAKLEKLRVIRKSDGAEMSINLRDYDEDRKSKAKYTSLHYSIIEGYDPDLGEPAVVDTQANSRYTAEDLALMKIADIRKCPEWSRIPREDRARLGLKQDYVDAILAQRKPRAVASESEGKGEAKGGRGKATRSRVREASGE